MQRPAVTVCEPRMKLAAMCRQQVCQKYSLPNQSLLHNPVPTQQCVKIENRKETVTSKSSKMLVISNQHSTKRTIIIQGLPHTQIYFLNSISHIEQFEPLYNNEFISISEGR